MQLTSRSRKPIQFDVGFSVEYRDSAKEWFWEMTIDDGRYRNGQAGDMISAVAAAHLAYIDWLNALP